MKEFIEKLIGRLEEIQKISKEQETYGRYTAYSNAIQIVNQLAEEYRQDLDKDSQGWISCSERLPNESERWLGHDIIDAEPREFIVMVKGAYEPTTGYYTVDGWVKDIYNKEEYGYADEIIAWMPFPEPFKPISE